MQPMRHDTWATVDKLVQWLDEHSQDSDPVRVRDRVLKLSEEVGEVAEALAGATSTNPRKGASHTWRDVEDELCDVILTAMVALRTITPDAQERFAERLRHIAARSLT